MLKEKVLKALERVRPSLQMDGGDIELVSVDEENAIVKVKLKGSCHCCPMSTITLKHSVERIIKEEIPEIVSVESVE
jgi:Fe-S cluster biogenesis protein NfuA